MAQQQAVWKTHGLFCDEVNNTCICSAGYTNLGDFSLFQDNLIFLVFRFYGLGRYLVGFWP